MKWMKRETSLWSIEQTYRSISTVTHNQRLIAGSALTNESFSRDLKIARASFNLFRVPVEYLQLL